jgi:hypothetical protein
MSDNTEDFKELMNEKFKSVHTKMDLQFEGIRGVLESIDSQVKKTNGKVLKLEDTVYNLQLSDAMKSINCPQHLTRIKEIEDEIETFKSKINTDLEEYNFFKKYPKIAIGTIAILVVILLLGYAEVRSVITNQNTKQKIEMNNSNINENNNKIDQNTANDKKRSIDQDKINQNLEQRK